MDKTPETVASRILKIYELIAYVFKGRVALKKKNTSNAEYKAILNTIFFPDNYFVFGIKKYFALKWEQWRKSEQMVTDPANNTRG